MSCPAIITGDRFLTRVLMHIDCQAQIVGSYGYQSLGEPGSMASTMVAGLLTLFVALFGIRLLFGPPPGMRDVVLDFVRIGIVLTLAFSWPAFRTLIHDVVVDGPASIATRIAAPGMEVGGAGFVANLQAADDAMLDLTRSGTGRNTGAFIDADAPGGSFASTALADESGYAWSRLAWLAGIIGVYGLLRLLAGLLLALAPLAAGLLLFEHTRGLFSGWLRGLVLALVGTIGATLVLGVELAAIGPWLVDALRVRQLGYATPAAPTELLAMTTGFAIVQVGMLAILARVSFTQGWLNPSHPRLPQRDGVAAPVPAIAGPAGDTRFVSRAERIADSVELQLRREDGSGGNRYAPRLPAPSSGSISTTGPSEAPSYSGQPRLGNSYRRSSVRSSRSSDARSAR